MDDTNQHDDPASQQADDASAHDDLEWQAQVWRAHQQSAYYRMFMIIGLVGLMVAGFLINQVKLSSSVTAMSIACMAPLAVLLLLGLYIIWRCPACDETLGRDDPQFCPGCGVQLR